MPSMTTVAIIFIPPGLHDGHAVLACTGHVIRRGYQLLTVQSDWNTVAAHLDAGTAHVVILATRTHRAGQEADRVEVVDEERTRILRRRNAAVGRHQMPDLAKPPNTATMRFTTGAILSGEVAAYRSGYADGYVDCTTVRSAMTRPPRKP